MGNSLDVTLKEDSHFEITEKMVRDFQDQVYLVDSSMAGLMKTLESLRVSCELFLRQVDDKESCSTGSQDQKEKRKGEDAVEIAIRLLKTIHESLSDHKKTAVISIRKLLHNITDTGRAVLEMAEEDVALILDEAVTLNEEDETRPYYEIRVELLRNELNIAKKLNKNKTDHIAVLNKKVETREQEVDVLRRRVNALENERKNFEKSRVKIAEENRKLEVMLQGVQGNEVSKTQVSTQSDELTYVSTHRSRIQDKFDLDNNHELRPNEDDGALISASQEAELENVKGELKSVKAVNESLEAEMKTLKKKQCIHVQTINSSASEKSIVMLKRIFESRIATSDGLLHFTEQTDASKLCDELPLIVLCNSVQGVQQSASRALDGITGVKDVALIVVHRVDNSSTLRESRYVLLGEKFKKLSGIFDVAYSFVEGLYQCELNSRNIEGIVGFIQKKGVRKSAVETYGLI